MLRLSQLIYVWLFLLPAMLVATVFFGLLCLLTVRMFGPARTARFTAVPWARLGMDDLSNICRTRIATALADESTRAVGRTA